MPGYNANGQPDPSQSKDYYCDANQVGGVYCPEMDIMEANQYAFAITPHKCDNPVNKHYYYCDRGGCGRTVYKLDKNAYGPGSQYTINTLQKFNVKTEFIKDINQYLT